jgi:hypothetical protein
VADYGVNINLKVRGQSGLDRLKRKVNELTASIDKIRGVDIMNPRNTGGKAGKGARNEIKNYRQDMEALVKSVKNARGAFGKTANQQIAAADALQEYANNLTLGTKAQKAASAAAAKQIKNIDLETAAILQNTKAKKNNRDLASRIGGRERGNKPLLPNPKGVGAALSSGLISGAFPLLFGQGPIGGAAGFAGGFGGTLVGGKMGGFAGGLVATAALQQFTTTITALGKLGAALNSNTKDVNALSEALGITGTEFEKNLQIVQKLQGEEAAFALARERMIRLVGKEGVNALTEFGDEFTKLGNNFAQIMTLMRSSFAKFLKNSGIGSFISKTVEDSKNLRQADQSQDKIIKDLVAKRKAFQSNFIPQQQQIDIAESVGIKPTGFFNNFNQIDNLRVVDKLNEKIIKRQKKINDLNKELNRSVTETKVLYDSIAVSVETGLVDAIDGAIKGTMTLGEVARSVFGQIQRSIIEFGVSSFLGGLPGDLGKFFRKRANGGPVSTGKSYMVGERGPEMFVPNSGGRIIPNSDMGGGSTSVVVNVDASGSSVEGDQQRGKELGAALSVAIQSELLKQKRPGGLLA